MASRADLKQSYIMRKILFTIVFPTFLLMAAIPFQNVSSQTETKAQNYAGEEKKVAEK